MGKGEKSMKITELFHRLLRQSGFKTFPIFHFHVLFASRILFTQYVNWFFVAVVRRAVLKVVSAFNLHQKSSSLNFPLWRTADRLVDRKIRTFVLEFYSGFHFTQSIFFLHTELSKLFASKSMETNSLLTEEREYRFKKCNRLWLRKIHKIGCHRSFFFPSLRVSREKFIPQLFRIYNLSWLVKGDRQTHIQHSTFHSALIFFLSDINEKFPFSSVH